MPLRAQQIIWKLYSPPRSGVRQVFALSRSEAETLPRLNTLAVISITAPDRPLANLDGFERVLRLSFADVDFSRDDVSKKAQAQRAYAFNAEHALAIFSFVDSLPTGVASIVVHCEGGYSRSCAVVLALHRLYGYQVDMEHLIQANPSILKLILSLK